MELLFESAPLATTTGFMVTDVDAGDLKALFVEKSQQCL
jgi:hypothetical protein